MLLTYKILFIFTFLYILYSITYTTFSIDYTDNKLSSQIKYQSYITKKFYETNHGYAFYDNIHLGVINSLYS